MFKLKSCPFCGGKAKILENNSEHNAYASVYCTKCRAEIRRLISLKYSAVDECVKAWNMRSEKEINFNLDHAKLTKETHNNHTDFELENTQNTANT